MEQFRKEKLDKLRSINIDPYPNKFEYTNTLTGIKNLYKDIQNEQVHEKTERVCGRVMQARHMGKAAFIHIMDYTDKLQIYVRKDSVGDEKYAQFTDYIDIGDFIGIEGKMFRTRTGELTVLANDWHLLSKSLRQLPEKWHGLRDVDTRYRHRYLDLISNPDIKQIFYKRAKIISSIREFLDKSDFLEVETPMIQYLAGGALARPFKTHHNTYNLDLFLRIAPELMLKTLVVGGIDRVYEIGKSFRNEGIDRKHNPEFTMIEVYQAYADYKVMIKLCQDIITSTVKALEINRKIKFEDKEIDILNFKVMSISELSIQFLGADMIESLRSGKIAELAKSKNLDITKDMADRKIFEHIFDELIQPKLTDPVFVTDYPMVFSPLAKNKKEDPFLVDRFELFIGGQEIANAYSELNDPEEQRKRFGIQKESKSNDSEDVHPMDEAFVTTLEHGMPPCGGLGIGIDRLAMLLTEVDSIREVILFPLLKPEQI